MSERQNKKLYNERQAARHALALMTKLAPGDEVVHIVNGTTGKVVEVWERGVLPRVCVTWNGNLHYWSLHNAEKVVLREE